MVLVILVYVFPQEAVGGGFELEAKELGCGLGPRSYDLLAMALGISVLFLYLYHRVNILPKDLGFHAGFHVFFFFYELQKVKNYILIQENILSVIFFPQSNVFPSHLKASVCDLCMVF